MTAANQGQRGDARKSRPEFSQPHHDPAVNSIIAAEVARAKAELLADLDERCAGAVRALEAATESAIGIEVSRLRGKREGVALVRDYLRAYSNADDQETDR